MALSERASARVRRAIEGGCHELCDGLAAVSWARIRRSANEPEHRFVDLYAGERHVQVSISPAGRSVRVFVDGKECA